MKVELMGNRTKNMNRNLLSTTFYPLIFNADLLKPAPLAQARVQGSAESLLKVPYPLIRHRQQPRTPSCKHRTQDAECLLGMFAYTDINCILMYCHLCQV